MQATLAIRGARDADAKAVIALLDAEGLDAAYDPREFLVAESGGAIVACARMRALGNGAHELASVAVAPALRGQGLGARLVRQALERAEGAVYALALQPGFFEKLGFRAMLVLPAELEEKANGICASKGFVAMRWTPTAEATIREIKQRYGAAAAREACCAPYASYSPAALAQLPEGAKLSLGTGTPVADAQLREGDVVVDLGSGGGIDVLLAAKAVGPRGRAIGIDFTPEMIAKARRNAIEAGLPNAEFHEAPIERIPLPDAIADVVISNCVINLSLDKAAVLREARRVLKPGGRFVVSDTLQLEGGCASDAPSCDCTTGALSAADWKRHLEAAGFEGIHVEEGAKFATIGSATIRATKPIAAAVPKLAVKEAACCGPECCH